MNKINFSFAVLLLEIIFVTPSAFAATSNNFEEDINSIGNSSVSASIETNFTENSNPVGNLIAESNSETGFGEDSNSIGNQNTGSNSETGFGEDSNSIGNQNTGSNSETGFGEDSNPVGGQTSNGTVNSSSSRGGHSSGSRPRATSNTQGEVLGASTDDAYTCQLFTTYMKQGGNTSEVMRLQEFLNKNLDITLPTTGYFGPLTDLAVRVFQLKYYVEVLKPWSDIGLLPNVYTPTGYVYKTTQHKINEILCPELTLPDPMLP